MPCHVLRLRTETGYSQTYAVSIIAKLWTSSTHTQKKTHPEFRVGLNRFSIKNETEKAAYASLFSAAVS